MKKVWYVYILECSDETLYTGITNDLDKRIIAHNTGKGAKYTKGRGPVKLKWFWLKGSKPNALKWEIEFKKYNRAAKLDTIKYLTDNRISSIDVRIILQEQGWVTEGNIVPNLDTSNDSVYMIWTKDGKQIYLGNFYIESDNSAISFPWSSSESTKKEIIAFLNEDYLTAFKKY